MSRENRTSSFETMMFDLGEQIELTIRHFGRGLGNMLTHVSEEIEKVLDEVDTEIEKVLDDIDAEPSIWDKKCCFGNKKPLNLELVPLQGTIDKELKIFKTDRYTVKLLDDAIIIPLRELGEDNYCGGIVFGEFELLADMIVHTEQGAVGQSIKRISNTALFLTPTFTFPKDFRPLEESNPLFDKAYTLLDQFSSKKRSKYNFISDEKLDFLFFFLQDNAPNFWAIESENNLVLLEGKEIYVITEDNKFVEVSGKRRKVHVNTKTKSIEIDPKSGIEIDFGSGKFSLSEVLRNLGEELSSCFNSSVHRDDWEDSEIPNEED